MGSDAGAAVRVWNLKSRGLLRGMSLCRLGNTKFGTSKQKGKTIVSAPDEQFSVSQGPPCSK